eukprot:11207170-Lingulodinium_polyedra.AAC.1
MEATPPEPAEQVWIRASWLPFWNARQHTMSDPKPLARRPTIRVVFRTLDTPRNFGRELAMPELCRRV